MITVHFGLADALGSAERVAAAVGSSALVVCRTGAYLTVVFCGEPGLSRHFYSRFLHFETGIVGSGSGVLIYVDGAFGLIRKLCSSILFILGGLVCAWSRRKRDYLFQSFFLSKNAKFGRFFSRWGLVSIGGRYFLGGGLFSELLSEPIWGGGYFQVGDLLRVNLRSGLYASGEGVGSC